jgi:ribose transport system permease protein
VFVVFLAADELQKDGGTVRSARNVRSLATQTTTVAVAALGMTLVVVAGGIDLSVGTALSLCATVLAVCLLKDWPAALALAAAVGTGLLAGLVNGLLVSGLRVVPFIVTLGTMSVYLGAAKLLADESTVRPNVLTQVPGWMKDFVSLQSAALIPPSSGIEAVDAVLDYVRLPVGVWIALGLAVLTALLLKYTVFSRHLFAVGSNEATARLCGIAVGPTKIAVYTLAGLFTGIAGLYQFCRLSVGNPTSGQGLELDVIAAVVIGGGSLSGGRGSVPGTLAGAGVMAVIRNGCNLLGLRNAVTDILLGAIVVLAVVIDRVRQQRLAA